MSKFGSKATNIKKLESCDIDAIVLDMYIFDIEEWDKNKEKCIDHIINSFNCNVIIRSSAKGEDEAHANTAGKYDSEINVPLDRKKIEKSIENVIASYNGVGGEILVQPFLANTKKSGVIFTYDVNNNIPYYIIEISETGDTSSVTGGISNSNRIYRIAREAKLYNELGYIIHVAKQIEAIFESKFLDIEFAIDESGNIVIFQVRELYCAREDSESRIITGLGLKEIPLNCLTFDCDFSGNSALLSNMTDWNPAELVGKHPYPLDYSLYNYTFTKDTWIIGREKIGYKHNNISDLTQLIKGYAYVNVQKDFNSYLPKGLDYEIECKLIDFYINELNNKRELYDKAEFEIVDTCYTLLTKREKYKNVLNERECRKFFSCLRKLTNSIILDDTNVIKDSINLFENLYSDFKSNQGIKNDLEYLREYGIIYSSIVRAAFVAYEELIALYEMKMISQRERDEIMNSIHSITTEQMDDICKFKRGNLKKEELVHKYRHIREDMFNILSTSKYENDDFYNNLQISDMQNIEKANELLIHLEDEINQLFHRNGLKFTIDELIKSIQTMFEYREKVKFGISVVLTDLYDEIKKLAKAKRISLEDIRYATIDEILMNENDLKSIVSRTKDEYSVQSLCVFPDIIKTKEDFFVVEKLNNRPNYITDGIVEADVVCLDSFDGGLNELKNKIVLIERADPGFDWIFGMGIVGIVTNLGGVASHMAIRAYEMDVPAIIGCGENKYGELKKKKRIKINCREKEYYCIN